MSSRVRSSDPDGLSGEGMTYGSTDPCRLQGTIARVLGETPGTAQVLLQLDSQEEGTVRVSGAVPFAMPGERLDLTGRWIENPERGRTFLLSTVSRLLPSDVDGARRFLSEQLLKTLGSVSIHRMLEHFGGEALTVLLEDPLRLTEIPGVPADKALCASEELRLKLAGRDAAQWLALRGIPTASAGRLVKRLGVHAAALLAENPYRLLEADAALSFADVDRIALTGGAAAGSRERITAAVAWAIRQAEGEGHACLPEPVLLSRLDLLLGSPGMDDLFLPAGIPAADLWMNAVAPPVTPAYDDRACEASPSGPAYDDRACEATLTGPVSEDQAGEAPPAESLPTDHSTDVETYARERFSQLRAWLAIPQIEREPLADFMRATSDRRPLSGIRRSASGREPLPEHQASAPARRIYSSRMLQIERRVAGRLHALLHAAGRDDFRLQAHDWAMLDGLAPWGWDDLQKKIFRDAGRHGVIVVTGGPGTGKTTLVKGLVRLFADRGHEVALTAPTGRAARRLTDATGLEAKTVHRLLEVLYDVGEEETLRFRKDREDPLQADVIILDEASMLDLPLFDALLAACGDTARLILVGDADQLPSVGAGRVLGDLIDSGAVPVTRLEQVFRQSDGSRIAANAQAILRGEPLTFSDEWGEFHLVRRFRAEHVASAVVQLCRQELHERYGFDAKTEIQVLSPMRKGTAGTVHLNRVLQDALNPAAPGQNGHAG